MTDNEKLIEDAAKAMFEVGIKPWMPTWEQTGNQHIYRERALAALAVFEKAHTPTTRLDYYDPARQDSIAAHDCVFEDGKWWFGHGMPCKHPRLHSRTPTDDEGALIQGGEK